MRKIMEESRRIAGEDQRILKDRADRCIERRKSKTNAVRIADAKEAM